MVICKQQPSSIEQRCLYVEIAKRNPTLRRLLLSAAVQVCTEGGSAPDVGQGSATWLPCLPCRQFSTLRQQHRYPFHTTNVQLLEQHNSSPPKLPILAVCFAAVFVSVSAPTLSSLGFLAGSSSVSQFRLHSGLYASFSRQVVSPTARISTESGTTE